MSGLTQLRRLNLAIGNRTTSDLRTTQGRLRRKCLQKDYIIFSPLPQEGNSFQYFSFYVLISGQSVSLTPHGFVSQKGAKNEPLNTT